LGNLVIENFTLNPQRGFQLHNYPITQLPNSF